MKRNPEPRRPHGKRRGVRAAVLTASLVIAAAVTALASRPDLLSEYFTPLTVFAQNRPSASSQTSPASSSPQSAASAVPSAGQTASSAPAVSASSQVSLATAEAQVTLGQAEKPLSVSVSLAKQRVTVYDAEERIVKQFVCSTGDSENATPAGTFRIAERGKSFYSDRIGEGGYYWTQFKGNYLFHSVPFDKDYNMEPAEAAKLGTPASHGCVRLKLEDAKWIYDHIPRGTVVTIQ